MLADRLAELRLSRIAVLNSIQRFNTITQSQTLLGKALPEGTVIVHKAALEDLLRYAREVIE